LVFYFIIRGFSLFEQQKMQQKKIFFSPSGLKLFFRRLGNGVNWAGGENGMAAFEYDDHVVFLTLFRNRFCSQEYYDIVSPVAFQFVPSS
jgi:hypothetical protein